MIDAASKDFFWASNGRLWHAIEDGGIVTMCDRRVPVPRSTMKSMPLEDERCAKCDKLVPANTGGM